jgi:hypothetical protein
MRDLTAREVAEVYWARLEYLARLRREHRAELSADGVRLLNRCGRETQKMIGRCGAFGGEFSAIP